MSDVHPEDLTEVVEADEIAAAAHGELGRIANRLYDEDASHRRVVHGVHGMVRVARH